MERKVDQAFAGVLAIESPIPQVRERIASRAQDRLPRIIWFKPVRKAGAIQYFFDWLTSKFRPISVCR